MDLNLEPIYEKIMQAVSAEEVFGVVDVVIPPDEQLEYLAKEYKKLKDVTDPKNWTNPEDNEASSDADQRLESFYLKAQERIKEGIYGLGGLNRKPRNVSSSFETSKRKYFIGDLICEGDISSVYQGFCEIGDESFGEVIIKVVDDPSDNDLMQNEIRILQILHQTKGPQWKHLPFLLDSFKTKSGLGNVLRKFNGYDLIQVREHPRYKQGIDRKHMVWMLNRILSAMVYTHDLGIVHCNIEPSHIMIKPDDHNVCILDWSYAAFRPSQTGDSFKVFTLIYSPPEVKEKRPPLPSSDFYSIGKVMIWLLGGNPETNYIPEKVEKKLRQFLLWFVEESPLQRPQDARKLHAQLIYTIESLWGKRRFLKFEMD